MLLVHLKTHKTLESFTNYSNDTSRILKVPARAFCREMYVDLFYV